MPSPPEALETLRDSIMDPSTHSYCLKNRTLPLLEAAVSWYRERYGLKLDPKQEALMLIGSQEGLGHLLLSAADQGDSILMTDVGYASYLPAVQIAGLSPIYLPLDADFLPHLEALDPRELREKRAKILLLNYPNNPTAATADAEFFQRAISFCKANGLLLIHDAPYVDLTYDEEYAPSPLSLPGGMDCCVELFSFSKSYHIAGFRLGFALGNRDALAALESVKAPIDFNQYIGIQRMGITCLQLPRERLRRDAATWRARAAAMVEALGQQGWQVKMPRSSMYLWTPLPDGVGDDLHFCMELVARTGVALAPGRGFGPGGHGYVRFALVQPEGVLREAAAKIGEVIRELRAERGQST